MHMIPAPRILLVAELTASGSPSPASLAAASLAAGLSQALEGEWSTLAFCCESTGLDPSLTRLGCKEVFHCSIDPAHAVLSEFLAPTVCELVRERQFGYVIGPSSALGRDLLPRVAGYLEAAYVGDCMGFRLNGAELRFVRPIHAGNVMAECRVSSLQVVLTARAAAFEQLGCHASPCPAVPTRPITPSSSAGRIESIGFEGVQTKRPALTDARVVVAGGRPLGAKYFDVLTPLADRFDAAFGATRALCDQGHVPSHFQVGQTGKIVAPDLYFAIGISGSVQHIAGMRGSQLVVAINDDANAPIFAFADIGLIGDLFRLVPELAARLVQGRLT